MSRNALLRINNCRKPLSLMTSTTPRRSIARIPYRSISSITPSQKHMKSIFNPQFQQSSTDFSTSTTKMSDTNKNFLLSEVFNVKGKVILFFDIE